MRRIKVMSVFGTRPEAVKMCPLIKALEASPEVVSAVCLTGQHRKMLDQVTSLFGVAADYDLDIMRPGQTLTDITCGVLRGMEGILSQARPDLVLVHGDTTTSFAAALAAFYQKIPVGHVEAGLRTRDKYSPYPEEMNRALTGRMAELHFAPTETNRRNLKAEGIEKNVFVTGNTVIDAFRYTVKENHLFKDKALVPAGFAGKKIILMTVHRRENLGGPMQNIFRAVRRIVSENPDVLVIYPVHLNPAVREAAFSILGRTDGVSLTEPLEADDMHNLMSRSHLVLTDSGGLQEEAPSFGVPVLVLRTETERPEAVEAGTVRMAGVEEEDIVRHANVLLRDPAEYDKMARAVNPYGDGRASGRILDAVLQWFQRRGE